MELVRPGMRSDERRASDLRHLRLSAANRRFPIEITRKLVDN